MYLEILGRTDVGYVRVENEDAMLLARKGHPPEFGDRSEFGGQFNVRCELGTSPILVAVADGMGGPRAGKVASTEALRFLAARFETLVEDDDVPAQLLSR